MDVPSLVARCPSRLVKLTESGDLDALDALVPYLKRYDSAGDPDGFQDPTWVDALWELAIRQEEAIHVELVARGPLPTADVEITEETLQPLIDWSPLDACLLALRFGGIYQLAIDAPGWEDGWEVVRLDTELWSISTDRGISTQVDLEWAHIWYAHDWWHEREHCRREEGWVWWGRERSR